jgi:hypothetical protein
MNYQSYFNCTEFEYKRSEVMTMIEIKDLSLASDVQDLHGESIDSSTASEIRGGYNPYNDPYAAQLRSHGSGIPPHIIAAYMSYR